jgi:hypothetical protein
MATHSRSWRPPTRLPFSTARCGQLLYQAVGLRKRFGKTTALDGLDLAPPGGRSWPYPAHR